jgi:hypothetical protein
VFDAKELTHILHPCTCDLAEKIDPCLTVSPESSSVSIGSRPSTGRWSSLLLRLGLSLYGIVLGAASLWLLLAELPRSSVTALPTSREAAAAAASRRDDALWSARVGQLRGELWAESSFTFADLEWAASAPARLLDEAKASATRAARLSPANSSVWLLLADLASRYRWEVPKPVETLKMAYYIGPHEDALVPLRLIMSARLDDATDPEFERLFRSDIETVLTSRPNLKPAVVSAYNQGTPQARHLIQDVASQIDSAFAQSLPPGPAR